MPIYLANLYTHIAPKLLMKTDICTLFIHTLSSYLTFDKISISLCSFLFEDIELNFYFRIVLVLYLYLLLSDSNKDYKCITLFLIDPWGNNEYIPIKIKIPMILSKEELFNRIYVNYEFDIDLDYYIYKDIYKNTDNTIEFDKYYDSYRKKYGPLKQYMIDYFKSNPFTIGDIDFYAGFKYMNKNNIFNLIYNKIYQYYYIPYSGEVCWCFSWWLFRYCLLVLIWIALFLLLQHYIQHCIFYASSWEDRTLDDINDTFLYMHKQQQFFPFTSRIHYFFLFTL